MKKIVALQFIVIFAIQGVNLYLCNAKVQYKYKDLEIISKQVFNEVDRLELKDWALQAEVINLD